jgi:hypothetical protein
MLPRTATLAGSSPLVWAAAVRSLSLYHSSFFRFTIFEQQKEAPVQVVTPFIVFYYCRYLYCTPSGEPDSQRVKGVKPDFYSNRIC